MKNNNGIITANWMRIVDKDKVDHRFTYTERELWVRKPFKPIILRTK
jgi:hypothetical protein